MTPEQNLIAALKEAINAIHKHDDEGDSPCFVVDSDAIAKWLAIQVTCPKCEGSCTDRRGRHGCRPCKGIGNVPLSEVI